MADGGSVTYCQKDLQLASFSAFEDLRKREQLCDVTIKVGNQTFSAHRVVLATAVPYFWSLFSELKSGEEEVAVEDLDPKSLESLIRFAYTGKVRISSENAQSLVRAAEFLGLTQVKDACLAFMSEKPDDTKKENILDFFRNDPRMIQNFYSCIRKNFEELSKGEEFLNLPFSCIKEIISADDLNVSREEIVFEAIIRWGKYSPEERQSTLPELFKEIRWAYLPVQYLIEEVDSEELIMSYIPCRELVNEVKCYHMMPGNVSLSGNWKLRPRNSLKNDFYAICACSQCRLYTYRFDFNKSKWYIFSAADMPNTESINHTISVNGKIYIVLNDRIGECNFKTHEWKLWRTDDMIIQGAAIVSYENRIYFFGSFCSKGNICTDCMFYFDTEQPQYVKLRDMPFRRAHAAAASLGESIYLIGGWRNSVGKTEKCSAVQKYIMSKGQWSDVVAPMLIARSHHSCTSMNGKIYVLGNESPRAEVYDPQTNQWNFLPFPSLNLACVSLLSDYDNIHAFANGGWENYNEKSRSYGKKVAVAPKGLVGVVVLRSASI